MRFSLPIIFSKPKRTGQHRFVNFHVDDGEFVFLLGHSGAGKSTLLKLILREETPTEGRVLVNGQDVARLRRRPPGGQAPACNSRAP